MTFPAGRGLPQECSEICATVLSVTAKPMIYSINMPAVVLLLKYSYWHEFYACAE